MGRVARQVEEDVDPVGADLLGQPLVAHADHVAPLGRGGLKTMGQVVLDDPVGVADRLMLFLAEVLQDADQEIADGVPAQIGRDEAQAQPAIAIADVLVLRQGAAQRRGVPALVLGMGFGQFCRRYAAQYWRAQSRLLWASA